MSSPAWFRDAFKSKERELGHPLDVADVWAILEEKGHRRIELSDPWFPQSYNYVILALPLTGKDDLIPDDQNPDEIEFDLRRGHGHTD